MGTHTAHGTDRLPRRAGTTSALALHASATSAHALTTLEQRLDSALVAEDRPIRPRQLSWNGVHVSEQLQRYAISVARGEELAPYRGPVLARSETVFPWNLEATPLHAQQRRVDPPWSAWQLAVLALLFVGVVFGGGASLLADGDGAELPLWTTAMLEPRLAEPAPAPAPAEPPPQTLTTSSSQPASGSRASRAAPARTRAVSVARTPVRTQPRPQQQPDLVASAEATTEGDALFVNSPSF